MSWRSSGWRVFAWIEALNTLPMPAPAPAAPPPAPTPRPMEPPALLMSVATLPRSGWKIDRKWRNSIFGVAPCWLLVARDRVTEVDRGQDGEDESLQSGDQHGLEEVDGDPERDQQPLHPRVADEHAEFAAHERDQHVAGEQVGPEPDGQRDQAQEVGEHLDHEDHRLDRPVQTGGQEAAEEADDAVVRPVALIAEEAEDHQREHQREGDVGVGGVDLERRQMGAEDRELVDRVDRQWDVADQVRDQDEDKERRDQREVLTREPVVEVLPGHAAGEAVEELDGRLQPVGPLPEPAR